MLGARRSDCGHAGLPPSRASERAAPSAGSGCAARWKLRRQAPGWRPDVTAALAMAPCGSLRRCCGGLGFSPPGPCKKGPISSLSSGGSRVEQVSKVTRGVARPHPSNGLYLQHPIPSPIHVDLVIPKVFLGPKLYKAEVVLPKSCLLLASHPRPFKGLFVPVWCVSNFALRPSGRQGLRIVMAMGSPRGGLDSPEYRAPLVSEQVGMGECRPFTFSFVK